MTKLEFYWQMAEKSKSKKEIRRRGTALPLQIEQLLDLGNLIDFFPENYIFPVVFSGTPRKSANWSISRRRKYHSNFQENCKSL